MTPDSRWRRVWRALSGASARSRVVAIFAVALMGLTVIGQTMVNDELRKRTDAAARRLARDSILSVEDLMQIQKNLSDQRVLLDDHILEQGPTAMTDIEGQLARKLEELRALELEYGQLIELPTETELWQHAQQLIDRFEGNVRDALALSWSNRDAEAHSLFVSAQADYASLTSVVERLIAVNHADALAETQRVRQIQRTADNVVWAVRAMWVVCFGLLAAWMVSRIAAYEAELEARNRDLDAFAGRVAHDLKNALGPVTMSTAMLRRHVGDAGRVIELAERTERASKRATEMLEALLAFSRGAQNVPEDEAAAVKETIQAVLDEVAPAAGQIGAAVDLGPVADVAVRCDARLLHIALANVVGNAVKYLEGRPEKRVHVSAVRVGGACSIDVEDTGPGISAHDRHKVFLPFYRVPGSRAPGTGIGLATVRRIVEARGGHVTVESEPGKGSCFHVVLPLVPDAVPGQVSAFAP